MDTGVIKTVELDGNIPGNIIIGRSGKIAELLIELGSKNLEAVRRQSVSKPYVVKSNNDPVRYSWINLDGSQEYDAACLGRIIKKAT